MPGNPVQQSLPESPLYIRWGPDKSPYALELKLELITFLRQAVMEASAKGVEIGGVLVGSLPTAQVQTLRIEDIELISRRAEDGPTFILDGGGERFVEVRRRARTKERSAVGFFRSHLRAGPLRPSLADRTLLAGEFKEPVYALLLAQGAEPFNAAFFVASNGPLPAESSVRELRLNAADFQSLPEMETDYPAASQLKARPSKRSGFGAVLVVFLVALCVGGGLFYFNESIFMAWMPSTSLGLDVRSQYGLLRIGWNHAARDIEGAQGALLTVRTANGTERRIRLGNDELRLGVVALENDAASVEVELTLLRPGGPVKVAKVWRR